MTEKELRNLLRSMGYRVVKMSQLSGESVAVSHISTAFEPLTNSRHEARKTFHVYMRVFKEKELMPRLEELALKLLEQLPSGSASVEKTDESLGRVVLTIIEYN